MVHRSRKLRILYSDLNVQTFKGKDYVLKEIIEEFKADVDTSADIIPKFTFQYEIYETELLPLDTIT